MNVQFFTCCIWIWFYSFIVNPKTEHHFYLKDPYLKGHTDVSMFLSSTYTKSLVCKQFTHSDISSLLKWSNTSVDVTPTTRPWISTTQGSGARMSLAYCFRSTNGGTGYTESWWASRHEGTISTCVWCLKKAKNYYYTTGPHFWRTR